MSMTLSEARTIAALRIHFGCSFSKLAGVARAIWGESGCLRMTGMNHPYGAPLGQDLVVVMEDALGLDRCESDNMIFNEQICLKCHHTQWYLSYPGDTAKECSNCGEMSSLLR